MNSRNSPKPTASDSLILGDKTRQLFVKANPEDPRKWLRDAPTCSLLLQHHIAHCGIMHASPPYEVLRIKQSGTFMLACFEGEGVVLVDGAWKHITQGQACLLPPFVKNALKCTPDTEWKFAWVRYEESRETAPIVSSLTPVSGPFDAAPLKAAIEGLHAEASGESSPQTLHHWSELVHQYVLRFARPNLPDERLWRLWQQVEAQLDKPWTLSELAAIACVSEEHLRRLCHRELGRSPMQHLIFLRLQQARELLTMTDDKLEVIALAVGFKSLFGFSKTFKTWIGIPPSEFRQSKSKKEIRGSS